MTLWKEWKIKTKERKEAQMKKKFGFLGIALMVVALVMLLVPGMLFADEPTTVTVNWTGAGGIGAIVNSGDAMTTFNTSGGAISGAFTAIDANNNPYSYGVDNFTTQLVASVASVGDGWISSRTDRLTSKESMYGAPGQMTSSFLSVTDGTGSMAIRTESNFASMIDPTYGYQLAGGHNIVADANFYTLQRYVEASDHSFGSFTASGNGQATLDSMVSEMSATGVRLGWGGGCYTDASFNATGSDGDVTITGSGDNLVKFEGLGIQSGGGALSIIANWNNSFSISNYSLTAN